MPNPSPHSTNNVVCMFPDFFSWFQHHVEWGRENCKRNLKRKHCFMRSPRNHRKLWKLHYRIPRFFVLVPVVQKLDSTIHWINYYPVDSAIRLRAVPHFSSGIVERAKRERAWKSRHARKGDTRRGVIFTRARVSFALLSLRKNGGLLVVYSAIHLLNNWGQYWRYTVHCINNLQNIKTLKQ